MPIMNAVIARNPGSIPVLGDCTRLLEMIDARMSGSSEDKEVR